MQIQYKFKNFNYVVNNMVTKTDISLALNKFYLDELADIDSKMKFSILFKIKTFDGEWKNISSLQILNKTKINELNDIFNLFWAYKPDVYKGMAVNKIVFRYRLLEDSITPGGNIFKYPTSFDKSNELLPQGYTNLPSNRLFEMWGEDITINNDNSYTVYKDSHFFKITQLDNEYFISLIYKNKEILNFHDMYEYNDQTNNTFIRTIGNCELYYRNDLCYFIKVENIWRIKGRITCFL